MSIGRLLGSRAMPRQALQRVQLHLTPTMVARVDRLSRMWALPSRSAAIAVLLGEQLDTVFRRLGEVPVEVPPMLRPRPGEAAPAGRARAARRR